MPTRPRFARMCVMLLAVCAMTLATAPALASSGTPPVKRPAEVVAANGHRALGLGGDTSQQDSARRASYAWRGHRIPYYETLPAKWDWALTTAVAKWNSAGGRIAFVRTTNRHKARLIIGYGNLGGAAGMATVGRSRHASVQLSSHYASVDALDAHNRIEVLGIFTHELGHVLGFEHTTARCSLMSPVLDVAGCHVLSETMPGYYQCRTIDPALVARFVRTYGGHPRFPAAWCPIEALPAPLTHVIFSGGATSPVTIKWVRPSTVRAGFRVQIRSWPATVCGAVPAVAGSAYAPVGAGSWQDMSASSSGTTCYHVELVNRYGAGRAPAAHVMTPPVALGTTTG